MAILILLPILLVADLAGIFLQEPSYTQSRDAWRISVNNPLSPVSFLLFVALAILTPFWAVRAHRNAQVMSGAPLKSSAGWTAGAWFIPVAGGFLAAGPMAQVLERSRAPSKSMGMGWGIAWSVYQVVAVVAFLVLFVTLFGQVFSLGPNPSASELDAAGQDLLQSALPWQLAMSAFQAVAAVFMALTVIAVKKAQGAFFSRGAGNPMMPPGTAAPWK